MDDFYLVKTDSEGRQQWHRTFDGGDYETAYSAQQTRDCGYVMVGTTYVIEDRAEDIYLVKTDSLGNEQWHRTIGGDDVDFAYSVHQTADGGYVLAGRTGPFGMIRDDFCVVKVDSQGNLQWQRTFGGENEEVAFSVQQTTDGGYVVAGFTYSFGAGGGDFWLVKTDVQGNQQWQRTFGGGSDDWAYSVQQTTDGGYVIAGYTYSFGAGGADFWLVKTGPDPVSVPNSDFILHPSAFILLEPYPNPFNAELSLVYRLNRPGYVRLYVMDIGGKLIRVLSEGWHATGEYDLVWEAVGFPSGIYFCVLASGDHLIVRKALLVR